MGGGGSGARGEERSRASAEGDTLLDAREVTHTGGEESERVPTHGGGVGVVGVVPGAAWCRWGVAWCWGAVVMQQLRVACVDRRAPRRPPPALLALAERRIGRRHRALGSSMRPE